MPLATSSVVIRRPMGFSTLTWSSIFWRFAGSVSPSQKMGVSVAPGQTQLTRTPKGMASSAAERERLTIAPFVAV